MLIVEELYKSFGKRQVLHGVSLSIPKGSIYGLVGVNGAGKTTLLNILWGKESASACQKMQWEDKPLIPETIAFLEAHPFFYSKITGLEYLQLFKAFNPAFEFDSWNNLFQLPLKELVDNYSSGMKKKLAIMALLSYDAPLLILDEPFNNLDIETNAKLKKIFKLLCEAGKTIMITSHVLETLTSFADAIALLAEKKVAGIYTKEEFGTIEPLLQREEIKDEVLIRKLIAKKREASE